MTLRQLKNGYFVLEGLNALASSFYFYYLFFYMQRQFGFGNLENLSLAALNGLVYTFMAWLAGRLGQRFGFYRALRVGFTILSVALLIGAVVSSLVAQIGVLVLWTIGLCFTWPMLEALVSEKEDAVGLQHMLGIYNLVWAGASALAYFCGGLLLETLGERSLFWIPLLIHLVQNAFLWWLQGRGVGQGERAPRTGGPASIALNPRPIRRARLFLRLSWWANPFAYVAINTVAAIVPGLARNLDLSPMQAGVFCSVWFFARVGTFLMLWLWKGWQYRLRWLLGAYGLLIASFACILLAPRLSFIVAAQLLFGLAVGLIYYSSLYYSMDVGEAKGEHSGMHEAAIGAGIFAGPALGATSLHLFPAWPNSSVWSVSLALCVGMAGLLVIVGRDRARVAPRAA